MPHWSKCLDVGEEGSKNTLGLVPYIGLVSRFSRLAPTTIEGWPTRKLPTARSPSGSFNLASEIMDSYARSAGGR